MAKTEFKTNVMRLLEQKKISYTRHEYDASGGALDGKTVAGVLKTAATAKED